MKRKQNGFSYLLIPVMAFVLFVLAFSAYAVTSHKSPKAVVSKLTANSSLPGIGYYETHKSDQFLVDMDVIQYGHPFMGSRSLNPHGGAHVNFGDDYLTWPKGGSAPQNYPKIYAVADGIISQVDPSYHNTITGNDQIGISLQIAKNTLFSYSIEPMIPQPSPGFYQKFVVVKTGDHVKKGQVIAYMYLPKISNIGTHIHFNLSPVHGAAAFWSPSIFSPEIVQAFHDRWGSGGYDTNMPGDTSNPIGACMGYKLTADENPFGTGATDCLN